MINAELLGELPAAAGLPAGNDTTLHDNLVAQLRVMLMGGELAAGSRISEAELCRRFMVSRTPLREALKVMAAEGFIILRPNRGAIVAPLDPNEIGPIFEFKGALERLIGLTVAERASVDEITALESIHTALGAAVAQDDHDAYTRLNFSFHQGLARASHNPVLAQNYETLQQKIWRYRFFVNEMPERLQLSFAEHEHIMTALRARTPLDLAHRLEEHNRRTGYAMTAALMHRTEDESSSKHRRTRKRG